MQKQKKTTTFKNINKTPATVSVKSQSLVRNVNKSKQTRKSLTHADAVL